MISIGNVVGGSECDYFLSHVSALARHCRERRDESSQTAMVNVVFHLSGSVWQAEFRGIRTAKFSRKKKIQMIQIGVEDDLIAGNNENEILTYVYERTDEALGMAKIEFDKKGIEYDLAADREFLDIWKDDLGIISYLDFCRKDEDTNG